MSNLSPIATNNVSEDYETVIEDSTDHDYEMLDKYSQAHEELRVPATQPVQQQQPLSSIGDYNLTQCPAYVPVATTSTYVNIS